MIVGVGAYSIPVTATNFNNLGSTTNVIRTFTANGLETRLSYDLSGNLLVKSNATQVLTFAWDGSDRCIAMTNGNLRTALAYDGTSRWSRIQEYSGASLTADRRFVWNGTSPAEERDSTGTTVVKRFYPNGFWQQGTNYYYITDHLGSVVAVTLGNGTVVARFEYDPWGRRNRSDSSTLQVDFGFAGLFELPNGLKLAVWRVYDPSTGRWNSRDPIREAGGWNLYAYSDNNPTCYRDIAGLTTYLITFRARDAASANPLKWIPHTAIYVETPTQTVVYSFDPIGLHEFSSLRDFMQQRDPKQEASLTELNSTFSDAKILEYYAKSKRESYLEPVPKFAKAC